MLTTHNPSLSFPAMLSKGMPGSSLKALGAQAEKIQMNPRSRVLQSLSQRFERIRHAHLQVCIKSVASQNFWEIDDMVE